jgi:hypothetical protein
MKTIKFFVSLFMRSLISSSFTMYSGFRLVLLFSLTCYTAAGQYEAINWYFGNKCGLSFASDPPQVVANSVNPGVTAGSSISEGAGNLLFYSNGNVIWNSQHVPMSNGTGLIGGGSTEQSGLAIKQPGNSNLYYVFCSANTSNTSNPQPSLYSIVDMNLSAGLGSVTVKNATLFAPGSEKVAATRHCNGTDVWIISHSMFNSDFQAFLLTSAGLNTVPVVSSIGPFYNTTNDGNGEVKFNTYGTNLIDILSSGKQVLYDFNKSTGVVSNSLQLGTHPASGAEFSRDGSKVYATANYAIPPNYFLYILQWDLCSQNPSAILSSCDTVGVATNTSLGFSFPQLAPNGRIYISRTLSSTLAVINEPDKPGLQSNFVEFAQNSGTNVAKGLPGFQSDLLKPTFSNNATQNCASASFSIPQMGCIQSSLTTGYVWNFGDPGSGAQNTSTLSYPVHQYNGGGTYTVMLVYSTLCGPDTLRQKITVGAPVQLTVTGTKACAGSAATLNAVPSATVSWFSALSSTSPIGSASSLITPTLTTGTYTYYAAGVCTLSSSWLPVTVTVNVLPVVTVVPLQATICAGAKISFTASGAITYKWTNGPGNAIFAVTPSSAAVYTVNGTDGNGCTNSVTAMVELIPCLGLLSEKVESVSIFPNPAGNEITVEFGSPDPQRVIELYDITGKLLFSLNAAELKNTIQLNTRPGMYVLKITSLKDPVFLKFIRQ